MNPFLASQTGSILTLAVALVLIALNLFIIYLVVKAAIVQGMRRARREEWTETFDAKNATWLTEAQRETLAARAPQLEDEASV